MCKSKKLVDRSLGSVYEYRIESRQGQDGEILILVSNALMLRYCFKKKIKMFWQIGGIFGSILGK